ncbi:MAG: hypothetical protein ACOYN0_14935 [Phycisphaerales bacterium]
MSITYWIILVAANIPVYVGLGWLVFRTWEEFTDCLGYWFKPDIISWFDGTHWEDIWAELKVFLWLAMCAFMVAAEHWALQKWVF